jgi:hypothetical protein
MIEEPPPLMEDWRDFVPSALLPEEARDGMGQIARELPVLASCDNVMVSPLSTNNSLKNNNDEEGKKPNGKFNYAI